MSLLRMSHTCAKLLENSSSLWRNSVKLPFQFLCPQIWWRNLNDYWHTTAMWVLTVEKAKSWEEKEKSRNITAQYHNIKLPTQLSGVSYVLQFIFFSFYYYCIVLYYYCLVLLLLLATAAATAATTHLYLKMWIQDRQREEIQFQI